MELKEKYYGDIPIIALHGNMVGECESDTFHAEIDKLVKEGQIRIVLDLDKVDWMGSLCVGAIMRDIISLRKKGGDIHLSGLSRKVQRVLEITKLNDIINIYNSANDAAEDFKNLSSKS